MRKMLIFPFLGSCAHLPSARSPAPGPLGTYEVLVCRTACAPGDSVPVVARGILVLGSIRSRVSLRQYAVLTHRAIRTQADRDDLADSCRGFMGDNSPYACYSIQPERGGEFTSAWQGTGVYIAVVE